MLPQGINIPTPCTQRQLEMSLIKKYLFCCGLVRNYAEFLKSGNSSAPTLAPFTKYTHTPPPTTTVTTTTNKLYLHVRRSHLNFYNFLNESIIIDGNYFANAPVVPDTQTVSA